MTGTPKREEKEKIAGKKKTDSAKMQRCKEAIVGSPEKRATEEAKDETDPS